MRVGILFTCEKYLQEPIIPLRGEVWALKTSFTSMIFIEAPVPSQEGGVMYVGVNFASSLILLSDFGTVSMAVWYVFPLILLVIKPTSYQGIIYES